MSNDPNQNRVTGLSGPEAKTPLERAKQIQEMQRQMEMQPVQPQQTAPVQHAVETQAPALNLHQAAEIFDVKRADAVNLIKGPSTNGADQALYGAKQVDEGALFGGPKGADIEVKGNPWKIIPFGPPQVAALVETKKPIAEYDVQVPQNAVKLKEGNLFQLTVAPKVAGSEPAQKKAVIVDDKGNLKGAEFKSKASLEKALAQIPTFTLNLFQSVFGDGVQKDTPKQHRIVSVETGKKSAYEVKIERKNDLDGKWKTETVNLNNFGLRVPPSNDPRRHDIVVAMYYLDRFNAA